LNSRPQVRVLPRAHPEIQRLPDDTGWPLFFCLWDDLISTEYPWTVADTGRVLYLNLYLAIFGVVQVVKMVQVMATITPILRTSKVGKDGLAPVWVRVSDTF